MIDVSSALLIGRLPRVLTCIHAFINIVAVSLLQADISPRPPGSSASQQQQNIFHLGAQSCSSCIKCSFASVVKFHTIVMSNYSYQPLNPSADTIRVLYFENFKKYSEPICCRLVHVEFGQRPKYNALSYTWGDESTKHDIYVDGQKVQVGFNLFDALKSLRRRKGGIPIWADAICINQQDIPERNRQLRIMPHIYARAAKVLVFLGSKSPSPFLEEKDRYGVLSRQPYWERVWIVQEISKARSIDVCVDGIRLEWDSFISKLNSFAKGFDPVVDSQCNPLKMSRHLLDRYEHNQSLMFLLETYESSKCKDPRDKIYGFIGLASDCHNFPIDYSKTTYEIWKDTVTFINRQARYDAWDMARFGKLIKRLLQLDDTPASDSLDPQLGRPGPVTPSPEPADMPRSASITLSAVISSVVICLGPPPEEIISTCSAVDAWAASVYENFNDIHGRVSEENDRFIINVEDLDQAALGKIKHLNLDTHVPLDSAIRFNSIYEDTLETYQDSQSYLFLPGTSKYRLFQHRVSKAYSEIGALGVCPADVCVGDLVCRLQGVDQSVIVRRLETGGRGSDNYLIVGTALLSCDLTERGGKHFSDLQERYQQMDFLLDVDDVFRLVP